MPNHVPVHKLHQLVLFAEHSILSPSGCSLSSSQSETHDCDVTAHEKNKVRALLGSLIGPPMGLQAAFKRAPSSSRGTAPPAMPDWDNVKPEEKALVHQVEAGAFVHSYSAVP